MKRTERSILLDAAAVRAILAGRKTQIRWIVKPQPNAGPNGKMVDLGGASWGLLDGVLSGHWRCPFGVPGDRLWAREAHKPFYENDTGYFGILFRDGRSVEILRSDPKPDDWLDWRSDRWRPSIHMFQWMSRITLEVTEVRVQRVQDISEEDAMAEGIIEWSDPPRVPERRYGLTVADVWETSAVAAYSRIWDARHGPGAFDRNDWVWAATFRNLSEGDK